MVQWQVAKEPFNLKGLAIGNGLTNPAIQYGSYADFSFANGLISKNVQSTLNAVSWPGHQCFLRTQQNSFDAYNFVSCNFLVLKGFLRCADLSNLQIWYQCLQHSGLGFCVQHCPHFLPGKAHIRCGLSKHHVIMQRNPKCYPICMLWTGHHRCTNPIRRLQCV